MLSRETVYDEVKEVIVKSLHLEPDVIQGESQLTDELKLDSLDMMLVVQELEENFKMDLPDDLVTAGATFNQLIDALFSLLVKEEDHSTGVCDRIVAMN